MQSERKKIRMKHVKFWVLINNYMTYTLNGIEGK